MELGLEGYVVGGVYKTLWEKKKSRYKGTEVKHIRLCACGGGGGGGVGGASRLGTLMGLVYLGVL